MSAENDLALAYHMGYDDALAKRKPDASKAQVLTPYDLATENNKLRELVDYMTPIAWYGASERERDRMRELGMEVPE